jgi:hypothetical protein
MDSNRRQELEFLLRIRYPLYVVAGQAHRPQSPFMPKDLQGDIFTLTELIEEGAFSIIRFEYISGYLKVIANVDICLHNGTSRNYLETGQALEISISDDCLDEILEFYQGLQDEMFRNKLHE